MNSNVDKTIRINGLDIKKAKDTQQRIRQDGDGLVAKPNYQALVTWESGYQTSSTVTEGQVIKGDEPETYGGSSRGPAPQDLLLTAIGNCLAATYIGGLTAAKISVKSLRIKVSGRVNFRVAYGIESGNPGFEGIDVNVAIETDSPQETTIALLNKLYPTAPIPDTIVRPVPLTVVIDHTHNTQHS